MTGRLAGGRTTTARPLLSQADGMSPPSGAERGSRRGQAASRGGETERRRGSSRPTRGGGRRRRGPGRRTGGGRDQQAHEVCALYVARVGSVGSGGPRRVTERLRFDGRLGELGAKAKLSSDDAILSSIINKRQTEGAHFADPEVM